jgi:hypothetical protein
MFPEAYSDYLKTLTLKNVENESFSAPAHKKMLTEYEYHKAAYWAGRFTDSLFNQELKEAGMHAAKWGATRRQGAMLGPMSRSTDELKTVRKTPVKAPIFTATQLQIAVNALANKGKK